MKIAVLGMWHLGSVTAACLAHKAFDVIAFDEDQQTIADLQHIKPPVFEPNLNDYIGEGLNNGKLSFTANPQDLEQADLIWVAYDTPVDDNDQADVALVMSKLERLFPHIKANSIVLISSQLPQGSTAKLQAMYQQKYANNGVCFAYSPENLRLGKAIDVFTNPDRIVVGLDDASKKPSLEMVLTALTDNIVWMSVASAEMTKHAINAFLATSVVFANELARLCEQVGADAREVERGLKSEERIGPKAYLRAGNAFAGGTLARDVNYLIAMGKQTQQDTELFSAVLQSNLKHREWAQQKLLQIFPELTNKQIAILGLTYKPGTDTLRRSTAIEICHWLKDQGAKITAYDPAIKQLPAELNQFIELKMSPQDAMQQAAAVIVLTEWPEFKSLAAQDFINSLINPIVIDSGAFLAKSLDHQDSIQYVTVGRSV